MQSSVKSHLRIFRFSFSQVVHREMITVWGHEHRSRQADDSCMLLIASRDCCSQLGRGFISYIWSVATIVCSVALWAGCSLFTPHLNEPIIARQSRSDRFWTTALTCQERNEKHKQKKSRVCVLHVKTKSIFSKHQQLLNLPHTHPTSISSLSASVAVYLAT